jgi:hypothetical protein
MFNPGMQQSALVWEDILSVRLHREDVLHPRFAINTYSLIHIYFNITYSTSSVQLGN